MVDGTNLVSEDLPTGKAAANLDEAGGEWPLGRDIKSPLVVDLDGTLFATDTLYEALLLLLKRKWHRAWQIPVWLARGRAPLKQGLSSIVTEADVDQFPVNEGLVALAKRQAELGRPVVLATGAARSIAEKAKIRFPFISDIVCTDDHVNMTGRQKAEAISERWPNGFIYAGNAMADVEVWRASAGAVFGQLKPNFELCKSVAEVLVRCDDGR